MRRIDIFHALLAASVALVTTPGTPAHAAVPAAHQSPGTQAAGGTFAPPRLALAAFGARAEAGGWEVNRHPRFVADLTGEGWGDVVGFGELGVTTALSAGDSTFRAPRLVLASFGATGGAGAWQVGRHLRFVTDVTADGRADIVGFADGGVVTAVGRGDGTFAAARLVLNVFGAGTAAGGWDAFDHPRFVADVTGDGRADIVGFGNAGVTTAVGRGDGTFATERLVLGWFGASSAAGGWDSQHHPRFVADVTGEGRADIVGFGDAGVFVSLGRADGTFSAPVLALGVFGASPAAGGWDTGRHLRLVADTSGDGRADIVGFGELGATVSNGQFDGSFSTPVLASNHFGAASAGGSWDAVTHPRLVGDITRDGRGDIVGFGNAGVTTAVGRTSTSFDPAVLVLAAFGASAGAGGWDPSRHIRLLADVAGDRGVDIVGFGEFGVTVSTA